MLRKIISVFAILFAISSVSVFAAKQQTKATKVDDENYIWYEFKAKQFGKPFKFFAFKTDAQRDNRALMILNKNGWGANPSETITEYFNFEAAEKTVLFDEELKPEMKKNGYKYAMTTYKRTTKDMTTIYLYTFWYDAETDALYVYKSYK